MRFVLLTLCLVAAACGEAVLPATVPAVAHRWNQVLLEAARRNGTSDPATARALGIMNAAMRDAWLRTWQRSVDRETAVSYAAYHVLLDLLPADTEAYRRQMRELRLDPDDHTVGAAGAVAAGNTAALAALSAAR